LRITFPLRCDLLDWAHIRQCSPHDARNIKRRHMMQDRFFFGFSSPGRNWSVRAALEAATGRIDDCPLDPMLIFSSRSRELGKR
jgi:hypothetical protein